MSTAFDRALAIVSELKTVEEGVVAAVDVLSTQVRDLAAKLASAPGSVVTEADLNSLADQLEAIKEPLAAAVVTGTAAEQPADTVVAGSGNDTIDSGAGNDTLTGAAGNDTVDSGAAA